MGFRRYENYPPPVMADPPPWTAFPNIKDDVGPAGPAPMRSPIETLNLLNERLHWFIHELTQERVKAVVQTLSWLLTSSGTRVKDRMTVANTMAKMVIQIVELSEKLAALYGDAIRGHTVMDTATQLNDPKFQQFVEQFAELRAAALKNANVYGTLGAPPVAKSDEPLQNLAAVLGQGAASGAQAG